jgi:hypothetical protein
VPTDQARAPRPVTHAWLHAPRTLVDWLFVSAVGVSMLVAVLGVFLARHKAGPWGIGVTFAMCLLAGRAAGIASVGPSNPLETSKNRVAATGMLTWVHLMLVGVGIIVLALSW